MKWIPAVLVALIVCSCAEKNQLPQCDIVQPSNDEVITYGDAMSVNIEANDPDGSVREVRLSLNGVLIATLTSSPFMYVIQTTNYETGEYTITATAVDNEGASATDEITVTFANDPPLCEMVQPQNDSEYTYGDDIFVSVSASDPDGSIQEVLVYLNIEPIKSLTSSPYEFVIHTDEHVGGEWKISAQAIDNFGAMTTDTVTVTVHPVLPTLSETLVTSITDTSAVSGGDVLSEGGAGVTARGVCWSTSPNPTIENDKTEDGTGNGSFTSTLTGLTSEVQYYLRAYATNSVGTGYGPELSFTTEKPDITGQSGIVTDIDGNTYAWTGIGRQAWMAKNLEVTHYNNGEEIPGVTGYGMIDLYSGAYCNYVDDPGIAATYGKIYNFYALTDSRKLCPAGWHVPDNLEWEKLFDHVGGTSTAGGKLKETGTDHWNTPNTGATNETGFTALPGGLRDLTGDFFFLGNQGVWWSSDNIGYILYYDNVSVGKITDQGGIYGYYVRCVRD